MLSISNAIQESNAQVQIDSVARVLVSEEAKKTFFEEGYLILRGVYQSQSEGLLSSCTRMTNEIIEELKKDEYPYTKEAPESYAHIKGTKVAYKKEDNGSVKIMRVGGCGSYDSNLLDLARSKEIVQAFATLLSSTELEHLVCQFHPKLPGDGVAFPRHIDMKYRKLIDPDWKEIGKDCSYAIAAIAVDDMTDDNGPLIVEPRSHLGENDLPKVTINLKAGDMLLMHPEMYHESAANHSNHSRMTLLTGYCIAGANSKNYPGNCTNDLVSISSNGNLQEQAAPWKVIEPDTLA